MATSIGRTSADLQVAIADWLLHSKIRIRTGRHAGAVAGWLNESGQPEFAYPEITGYYLSWLAFMANRQGSQSGPLATSVVNWLSRVTSDQGLPATRYYFDGRDDWRNRATFTFDLAMLCRGLHAVRGLVPEQLRRNLLQTILHHVLPSGDELPVFINLKGVLPDTWSTKPGPFQLKTAASLLSLREHAALWKTFYRWSGRVLDGIDASELHAAFYALEGLMQFGVWGKPESLREAANCFEVLFAFIDDVRSDVIAQALRIGCKLQSFGFLRTNIWKDRLTELHFRLEAFVADSGAVSFRPFGSRPVHFNAWASIFAHQYFSLFCESNRLMTNLVRQKDCRPTGALLRWAA